MPILLVEDSADDEYLTVRALKRARVCNDIIIARDGAEAIDYLRNGERMPCLVLLDLKLPKVDGLEVLQSIRGDDKTKLLPVVVFTSSVEERDIIDSYRLGVNSYVQKPVESTAFTAAVIELGLYWLVLNEHPQKPPIAKP